MKRGAIALATGAGIAALIALPLAMPRKPRGSAPKPQAVVANVRVPVQPPATPSNVATPQALLGELTLEAVAMAAAAPCPSMLDCGVRDKCLPPATFRNPCFIPPADAPVRFGREVCVSGNDSATCAKRWVWLKAGDPSRRGCDKRSVGVGDEAWGQMLRACDAKIGDVLYQTRRFK